MDVAMNIVPRYLPLRNKPSTAITGRMQFKKPRMHGPMAMKKYLKWFPSSVSMCVTLPGTFVSNIAAYDGNKAYGASGEPRVASNADSLTRHALS